MGRYSDSSEQRFRQLFERGFDWMQFNLFLMRQRFGENARKAIAIDASYISSRERRLLILASSGRDALLL